MLQAQPLSQVEQRLGQHAHVIADCNVGRRGAAQARVDVVEQVALARIDTVVGLDRRRIPGRFLVPAVWSVRSVARPGKARPQARHEQEHETDEQGRPLVHLPVPLSVVLFIKTEGRAEKFRAAPRPSRCRGQR